MPDKIDNILNKLQKSNFRAKQKLNQKDRGYFEVKGDEVIRRHARDFMVNRLAPARPENDGKQTPFRGHPVFTAQHATATCCRKCLSKWHGIGQGRELTEEEVDYVVKVLIKWLKTEIGS